MPLYVVVPFACLLILIATGPLFFARFWERHYPKISIGLGAVVAIWLLVALREDHRGARMLTASAVEYFSFIALIGSLFTVSGGVLIRMHRRPSALGNVAILLFGSVLAGFVGTTGASMLLIRPFLRFNKHRLRPYLVVFFIFTVSNVGGALTPIGDPPLFLGYLHGVPFFWMLQHGFAPWLFTLAAILIVFFFVDRRHPHAPDTVFDEGISIRGIEQFVFLAIILGLMLVQKADVFRSLDNQVVMVASAALMIAAAWLSHRFANRRILEENQFGFGPLKEVAILFGGIFLTMAPALHYLGEKAPALGISEPWQFYLASGSLSSVLDNAPTYLTFLSVALGLQGIQLDSPDAVATFLAGTGSAAQLLAISLGSVFWGAMTYIGNGPNFMVKNIADGLGVKTPSFIEYVVKYSIPVLLPILLATMALMEMGIL